MEEVELRASGFEKEELLGLTDGGKPGPENAYFSVAADLFIPELVCYWNIVDIRDDRNRFENWNLTMSAKRSAIYYSPLID